MIDNYITITRKYDNKAVQVQTLKLMGSSSTRGHDLWLAQERSRYDLRKKNFQFKSCKHVELALTKTVTCFKSKLDEFWPYQQDIIHVYDFRVEITATVNRNNM